MVIDDDTHTHTQRERERGSHTHAHTHTHTRRYMHPTAWVGQQAVDWITTASDTVPWFLKISFHRPHSPYDPPARVLNATLESALPGTIELLLTVCMDSLSCVLLVLSLFLH
jgi:hypothetical protein